MPLEAAGLAIIAAMEPEASVVRGHLDRCQGPVALEAGRVWQGRAGAHRVILCRCGMGAERAVAAMTWLAEHEPLWGVLSIGFAGGLQPALTTGDVVLAERIQAWPEGEGGAGAAVVPAARLASLADAAAQQAGLSRHRGLLLSHKMLVPSALEKRVLGRYTGALAVDMESYDIGSLAAAHGLPFVAMRAILDPCGMELKLPLDGLTTEDGGVRPAGAALVVVRQPGLLKSFWTLWRLSRMAQRQLAVWLKRFFTLLDMSPHEEDVPRS